MAERYAAQRSRKDSRRRSLPRLSDEGTIALQDRDDADGAEAGVLRAPGRATFTAGAASTGGVSGQSVLPRRAVPAGRPGRIPSESAIARVDYGYVKRDLRRIAVTAVVMLILLIVLNVLLQAVVH